MELKAQVFALVLNKCRIHLNQAVLVLFSLSRNTVQSTSPGTLEARLCCSKEAQFGNVQVGFDIRSAGVNV